jgi:hypothetical protein
MVWQRVQARVAGDELTAQYDDPPPPRLEEPEPEPESAAAPFEEAALEEG